MLVNFQTFFFVPICWNEMRQLENPCLNFLFRWDLFIYILHWPQQQDWKKCYMYPKPLLKIGTANAICWDSLGLFRNYDLNYIFLGIKLFCFSTSVWKRISWNLTKFQNSIRQRIQNMEIEIAWMSWMSWNFVRNSFSNRCWKFQLSILKNKKVLFLKNI